MSDLTRLLSQNQDRCRRVLNGGLRSLRLGEISGSLEHAPQQLIFPGAFNPLHDGHVRMATLARIRMGRPVEFEMAVVNVDKPSLSYDQIEQRVAHFPMGQALWLTRASTFVEKSLLFPAATFVVGADTVTRICDPEYYGNGDEGVTAAVATLARRKCRFLVFGRADGDQFQTLDTLKLPAAMRRLCQGVDEDEFRNDVSSTQIRAASEA